MRFEGSVLALNAGSSSLKFGLFHPAEDGTVVLRGEIEEIPTAPRLVARGAEGGVLADRRWPSGAAPGFDKLLQAVLDVVEGHPGSAALAAVGHRVVHGGAKHVVPARITPALLIELEALTPLDPLPMPQCLAPMQAIASMHPGLSQIACFDTAFHHTIPAVATRIALPRALTETGLRRYGFHGLSYDYVARELGKHSPAIPRGRAIVAYLGSGASLCALQVARSIATTMGFSVLDGLVMATRCGSLDPRRDPLPRAPVASDDPRAREAIDLFTYRVATETGALVSALDGLVFTAGIGEHAPAIRAEICGRLAWLCLRLDEEANAASLACISAPDSQIEVRVIATDEEAMIARHTQAALG